VEANHDVENGYRRESRNRRTPYVLDPIDPNVSECDDLRSREGVDQRPPAIVLSEAHLVQPKSERGVGHIADELGHDQGAALRYVVATTVSKRLTDATGPKP
jgi:hypothetical protein